MNLENVERYLDSFGKYVVKQARTNLTKGKKNVNKALYNSIKFEVIADANEFTIKFSMLDYGAFVDKGVSGNQKRQNYKDYKGKTEQSPFSFRSKQPPSGIIEKWIKARGIKARDEKGRFASVTRKSLAFLIARSIKIRGIKSTSFFQRPLELGMKNFSENYAEALKEDILKALKTETK